MRAKKYALIAAAFALCAGSVRADDSLRKAQQQLRDQGFYYGQIDGQPGDETTQALRRFQIRNGLAVTGQLNDETSKSLTRNGSIASTKASAADAEDRRYANAPAPSVPPTISGDDENAPRRNSDRSDLRIAPAPPAQPPGDEAAPPPSQGIRPSAGLTDFFAGTPYEFAPPPVQADVLRRAQMNLARSGFFGGEADGVPGPATGDALAEFQSANRLRRTGRMDVATLEALRLMPAGRPAGPFRGGPPVYEGRIVR